MTQEEKELLLKDLSARLPYHVRCKIWLKDGTTEEGPLDLQHNYDNVLLDAFYYNKIKDIKPYLRPLSSMTEEEKKEFCKIEGRMRFPCEYIKLTFSVDELDWLNAHHFDYRKSYDPDRKEWLSMIERGLAVEVTKENNPYDGSINTY